MDNPYILDETSDYAVVFKPPKMHCTSADGKNNDSKETLFNWYAQKSVKMYDIMHRLDYETHGLVLFAKNEKSFLFFKDLQDKGEFVKEYSAVCYQYDTTEVPGFPDLTFNANEVNEDLQSKDKNGNQELRVTPWLNNLPYFIESYFRPFGPGRKLVRPVIDDTKNKHKDIAKDKNDFYKTKIISIKENVFTVQIKRGFRHQIRCHLCWIGYPILNDPLYPVAEPVEAVEVSSLPPLALCAQALYFIDPSTGEKCTYLLPDNC